jgi:hypothetical protein
MAACLPVFVAIVIHRVPLQMADEETNEFMKAN